MERSSLLIYFLLPWLIGCSQKERIIPVVSVITESVYASGIVKSVSQYKVYSDVNGILHQINVKEGDTIAQGYPLFIIKNTTSRLNLENSRLALELSKENMERISDLERNIALSRKRLSEDSLLLVRQRNLWSQNVGTKVELEQRELAYQASRNNYLASLAELKQSKVAWSIQQQQARNNLRIREEMEGNYIVKSGIQGKVYDIFLKEGEYVTGQTALAIVGKSDSFLLEIQVDEYDIARVKEGQEIFITMDSYKGQVFNGRITKVYPIMNERTGTFTVEGSFTKVPPRLYPNLTVETNILIRSKSSALIIPRSYLIDDTYVLVEEDKKVKVNVGLKNYEYAEILSGLDKSQYIYKP